jgi:hypothetical protein
MARFAATSDEKLSFPADFADFFPLLDAAVLVGFIFSISRMRLAINESYKHY